MTFDNAALHIFPGTARTGVGCVSGFATVEFNLLGVGEGNISGVEAVPQVLDEEETFRGTEVKQGGVFGVHGGR
jgi:hypothetical protein